MGALVKARLAQLHHPDWGGTWTWLSFAAAFLIGVFLLALTLTSAWEWYWQLVVGGALVVFLGHLMHAHLIAFHESAHGSLCPAPWLNESIGLLVGPLSLMSLTLYRAAHYTHHVYLATERDEELWPFTSSRTPRWARRLAAAAELTAGLVYTPLLFLRAFLRPGTVIRDRAVRRRIWIELALIAGIWAATLAAVAWWQWWGFLVVLYLLPSWLAGNMQSLRKYIEHVGLTGATAWEATRTIVSTGWAGRLVAFSLFNEPYHGFHHRYPRIPQGMLPRAAEILLPATPSEVSPYPSYRRALREMLVTLGDPRVGGQWQRPAIRQQAAERRGLSPP